jgi:hypothetical protein
MTMNLRLILPASAAILMVATSCTPYKEPPPPAPTDPAARTRTPEEEEKLRKEREEMKKKDEEGKTPDKDKKSEGTPDATTQKDPAEGGESDVPRPPVEKKAEIQVARPVPGKPGFVFSPFNNKVIDVKGIPSGRLVADPTYPASEKKHFRVP